MWSEDLLRVETLLVINSIGAAFFSVRTSLLLFRLSYLVVLHLSLIRVFGMCTPVWFLSEDLPQKINFSVREWKEGSLWQDSFFTSYLTGFLSFFTSFFTTNNFFIHVVIYLLKIIKNISCEVKIYIRKLIFLSESGKRAVSDRTPPLFYFISDWISSFFTSFFTTNNFFIHVVDLFIEDH